MADTGYKAPTATGAENNKWTNPANAYANDGSYATRADAAGGNAQSYETFGFGLPAGAIINGIIVQVEAKINSAAAGHRLTINLKGTTEKTTTDLTTSDVLYTLGASNDLWGDTWTAANLSDVNFHLNFNLPGYEDGYIYSVDYVQMIVYYTPASGPANLKTLSTNAKANIKTISTNVIANVKTVSTIT